MQFSNGVRYTVIMVVACLAIVASGATTVLDLNIGDKVTFSTGGFIPRSDVSSSWGVSYDYDDPIDYGLSSHVAGYLEIYISQVERFADGSIEIPDPNPLLAESFCLEWPRSLPSQQIEYSVERLQDSGLYVPESLKIGDTVEYSDLIPMGPEKAAMLSQMLDEFWTDSTIPIETKGAIQLMVWSIVHGGHFQLNNKGALQDEYEQMEDFMNSEGAYAGGGYDPSLGVVDGYVGLVHRAQTEVGEDYQDFVTRQGLLDDDDDDVILDDDDDDGDDDDDDSGEEIPVPGVLGLSALGVVCTRWLRRRRYLS